MAILNGSEGFSIDTRGGSATSELINPNITWHDAAEYICSDGPLGPDNSEYGLHVVAVGSKSKTVRLDKFWHMIYDFQAELHGTGSHSLHSN